MAFASREVQYACGKALCYSQKSAIFKHVWEDNINAS